MLPVRGGHAASTWPSSCDPRSMIQVQGLDYWRYPPERERERLQHEQGNGTSPGKAKPTGPDTSQTHWARSGGVGGDNLWAEGQKSDSIPLVTSLLGGSNSFYTGGATTGHTACDKQAEQSMPRVCDLGPTAAGMSRSTEKAATGVQKAWVAWMAVVAG